MCSQTMIPSWNDPSTLRLPQRAVLNAGAKAALDEWAFPDVLAVDDEEGTLKLPLEYVFAQGRPEDGLTATIELRDLPRLTPERAGWLVPGLLPLVVIALLK